MQSRNQASTDNDEEVSVRPGEDRNVHRNTDRVRLVESDSKVALAAQQQQDEHSDVHQSNAR